ncbi:MAG: (d)CMP kinase [Thermomicrobiales bacterium]
MTTASAVERGEHARVIAIDGPAAAGKSTVARTVAERLGALLFDTGALYRVIALLALRGNVSPHNEEALCRLAVNTRIDIRPPSVPDGRLFDVLIGGEDVTWRIREPDVGSIVSQVSEHAEVRAALMPLQRRIASAGPVVMVGRDIGTVVVPDAGLKIYLDASPEERARRRYAESHARDASVTLDEVRQETLARDAIDIARAAAPLRPASDATLVQTDDLDIDEVVTVIIGLARNVRSADGAPVWSNLT